jgi:hypothetical protein
MKLNRSLLPALCLLFSSVALAQHSIFLRSGPVAADNNLRVSLVDSMNARMTRYQGKALLILHFAALPDAASRKLLSAGGIELLEYIPDRAYTATVAGRLDLRLLQQAGVLGLMQLSPNQKMDARLARGVLPPSAVKVAGTVDVWVSFPRTFSALEAIAGLKEQNIDVLSTNFANYRILSVRVSASRLSQLASLPFIDYIQPAPGGDQVLNYNSRYGSRANLLNADVANGGKGLNGEGIVLGIGDNADVQTHIDFAGRLIDRAAQPITAGHGHHTTGTMAGAGNGNELYRGYAPKATIISQSFNGIILNAPAYVQDYGMVVTNNSYGDNIDCGYYGTYDLYSRLLDQQAFDLPNLQNVFSAGNSGLNVCSPFQPGYHTVLGGYQTAKNVISVGASTDSGLVSTFSSRGPVLDGRIKPEILAMGQNVASDWAGNIYAYNNGTSMAGPAVSGGLGLLYQRYRQLNGGANPKNGLMKALVCNGASDRGTTGPDFQYGYGWMNLLRSIDMMEQNHYFNASVATGATNTHTITIPANTAQLKVMLYWNDPAASPLSARNLVNDLDLQLADPSSTVTLPKILDTLNANLGNAAVSGADHVNNMEQVVINQPATGIYTVSVKGTAIAQNPTQEYFVVYDIVPVQLKLTAPVGGEGLAPTTSIYDMSKISWEANGFATGTATIEFSTDNGATWSTVASGVDINRVVYTWIVPNVATSQALIRITKNGSGETSTSNPFTIIGQPVISLAPVQCEGYININWTAVSGATDYEVMMVQGGEMKSVAITTSNNYLFHGLSKDSSYAVTVRARINGKPGRRAPAVFRQPNTGNCDGSFSDNDLKLDAIVAPKSGRKFTSTQLSATSAVTVRIRNLDDVDINSFTVKYSINGGASYVTETASVNVPANGSALYTFTTNADLSAVGQYSVIAVVKHSGDPETLNDTARAIIKQLDNQPLVLTTAFLDNLETAATASYERDTTGLNGLDRYDFSRTTPYGRLRTFINTGIAYSGSKALTLDALQYYPSGNTNYLVGTFNLTNYNITSNDLRLDFVFNNHGQVAHPNNRVWIRGNDTQPWVEAYNLDINEADPGQYKKTSSIELSDLLAATGQTLGTSFQVRWGQFGQIAATDRLNAAGYSFDDIRIYEAVNDLQLLSIDAPVMASCGLTNASIIKVSVRNSVNVTVTSVPVKYRINGGAWINDTIPSIGGNATVPFNFATTADLSALGNYTIQALVDFPSDNFRENDTITAAIVNAPVITSYPYLQNFESGTGYWYSNGKNSSWEYGTPASGKINRAASGAKAWKTRLAGNYNDNELSYLYSPCFNVSGITSPTLSFSVAMDIEDCGAILCDAAWVEYSSDGISWTKLGTSGSGTNWYNKTPDQLWSIQDNTRWHVVTMALPTGLTRLRLRLVMQSDQATNREGLAIDDIHIYSNTQGIYDGVTLATPVNQPVSGSNWVDFTSGGKLVASIQPNGQNLGSTDVQAFINTGAVRYTNSQYYHDRNITVKPASNGTDSVSVRFYFLDKETDTLVKATGCPACSRPASAYELGVSKYTDPDRSFENGTISDDQQGVWTFMSPDVVAKVPFDKGYYAEFKVKDFSEFWLNNGSFNRSTPLPVKLLDFTAQRSNGNDVLVKWLIASETDVLRYEIELARGNTELQAGHFVKIAELASQGNTTQARTYSIVDNEADKFGARYYRLKIINTDGSFKYSAVRAVVFDEAVLWRIYPNPSTGLFNLVYQLDNNSLLTASVLDAKGSVVQTYHATADGFVQKMHIDLSPLPAGVYMLRVHTDTKDLSFKLFKSL